jgi:hypothetical protein
MSYQPYPSGGSYQPYPGGAGGSAGYAPGQQPPQPTTVRNAVRLMFGGAAVSLISFVLVLAFSGKFRTAVLKALRKANAKLVSQHKTPLTAAQMHTAVNGYLAVVLILLVIGVALWVWMAWANGKGKGWARIVSSVLFALNTIYLLLSISRASIAIILVGIGWLCGLGAIILIWNKQSAPYYAKPGQL